MEPLPTVAAMLEKQLVERAMLPDETEIGTAGGAVRQAYVGRFAPHVLRIAHASDLHIKPRRAVSTVDVNGTEVLPERLEYLLTEASKSFCAGCIGGVVDMVTLGSGRRRELSQRKVFAEHL